MLVNDWFWLRCICCWLCCVQKRDPALDLWYADVFWTGIEEFWMCPEVCAIDRTLKQTICHYLHQPFHLLLLFSVSSLPFFLCFFPPSLLGSHVVLLSCSKTELWGAVLLGRAVERKQATGVVWEGANSFPSLPKSKYLSASSPPIVCPLSA